MSLHKYTVMAFILSCWSTDDFFLIRTAFGESLRKQCLICIASFFLPTAAWWFSWCLQRTYTFPFLIFQNMFGLEIWGDRRIVCPCNHYQSANYVRYHFLLLVWLNRVHRVEAEPVFFYQFLLLFVVCSTFSLFFSPKQSTMGSRVFQTIRWCRLVMMKTRHSLVDCCLPLVESKLILYFLYCLLCPRLRYHRTLGTVLPERVTAGFSVKP